MFEYTDGTKFETLDEIYQWRLEIALAEIPDEAKGKERAKLRNAAKSLARNAAIRIACGVLADDIMARDMKNYKVVNWKIKDVKERKSFYFQLARKTFLRSLAVINNNKQGGMRLDLAYDFNVYFWSKYNKVPLPKQWDGTFKTLDVYCANWFFGRNDKKYREKASMIERGWIAYNEDKADERAKQDELEEGNLDHLKAILGEE